MDARSAAKLIKRLDQLDDWLSDDGARASARAFDDRLVELRQMVRRTAPARAAKQSPELAALIEGS